MIFLLLALTTSLLSTQACIKPEFGSSQNESKQQSNKMLAKSDSTQNEQVSYGGFGSEKEQQLKSGAATAIEFESNRVAPKGVRHPVGQDNSLFQMENEGKYLVTWHVTVSNSGSVHFQLFNASTQTNVDSSIDGNSAFADRNEVIGQSLITLTAGALLQLRAVSSLEDSVIKNICLTITQI